MLFAVFPRALGLDFYGRSISAWWNLRRKRFTVAVGLVAVFYFWTDLSNWIAIDRCLDNGGKWDYNMGHCDGVRAGEQLRPPEARP